MGEMLIWDGLQVNIPRTMEAVALDRGFIRLFGPELPTVEFRFGPEKSRFDSCKDGRRILQTAGLSQETIQPCNESWAHGLPGTLYNSSRLYLFQFNISRGIVAVLFSAIPSADMVKAIFTSLNWFLPASWRRWYCHDITFETPPNYALNKASFRPGRFHLTFTNGPGKLVFDRLAPANVLLENLSLMTWCGEHLRQGVHSGATIVPLSDTEVDVRQKSSFLYRTFPWLPGLTPPLKGKIRHLVGDNRILVVFEQGPDMPDATYQRIHSSYAITPSLKK
jgi:hypothetical protein